MQLPDLPRNPRILLPRPDHLGDVVLALHAAPVLRERWPDAWITAVVAPAIADIPRRCPFIDEVQTIPFPPPTAPDDPPGWSETIAAHAPQWRERFDLALLTRIDDPWSGALVAAAGVPERVGYAHARTLRYLTNALPVPARQHAAETALTIARATTGSAAPMLRSTGAKVIAPTDADLDDVAQLLDVEPTDGPAPSDPLIVLHPGAGWALKAWPVDRWAELARRLAAGWGTRPVITGGPAEIELVSAIVAASRGAARGIAGQLSLGGLTALLQQARLVVAIDSGPLHLAAAVGTPVIGLYGPADEREFGPWTDARLGRVVRVELPCRPCRSLINPPCGALTRPACMLGITVDDVLMAAGELFSAGA